MVTRKEISAAITKVLDGAEATDLSYFEALGFVALDWLDGHDEPRAWIRFQDWKAETETEAGQPWCPWTFYQAARLMESAGCIKRRPGYCDWGMPMFYDDRYLTRGKTKATAAADDFKL